MRSHMRVNADCRGHSRLRARCSFPASDLLDRRRIKGCRYSKGGRLHHVGPSACSERSVCVEEGEERCGLQRLSPLPPCRSAAGLFFFSLLAFKFLIALAAQKEEERTPTSSHPPSPSASTSSLYSARRSTFDVFFFPIWNKSPHTVTMAIPLFFFCNERSTHGGGGGEEKSATTRLGLVLSLRGAAGTCERVAGSAELAAVA